MYNYSESYKKKHFKICHLNVCLVLYSNNFCILLVPDLSYIHRSLDLSPKTGPNANSKNGKRLKIFCT